jgi:UDP-N-acetylmuramoyl-L-alanyl-D-glutamate--2,6-diaminopimelate ligase
MKTLKDILYKAGIIDIIGTTNMSIPSICFDSRKISKGCLFVAVRGTKTDGHDFIDQAVSMEVSAIVCEEFPSIINPSSSYVKVKDSSIALGYLAANFYDNPAEKIKLIGITGTNGKTTTATLLFKLFRKLGYNTGLLSTVKNQINDQVIPSTHTTPDALQLNALLSAMVSEDCEYCFMEVSSHAVVQNRIKGVRFTGGVFTNITRDHLDYHQTFSAYIKAKQQFFDELDEEAFALTNIDDKNGEIMLQNTKAKRWSYSLKGMSDFKCKVLENNFSGLLLNIDGQEVLCKLIGSFNAYNLLAVYGTAVLLEQDRFDVLTALSDLGSVEGRFDYIQSDNNITGIVDYAHTPDALENVLNTISDIRGGHESVITVIGCGGDRDSGKRPIMAKIACEGSNKVILTSDNPRSEDPQEILTQMQKGVTPDQKNKTLTITDRKEAIKTACALAKPGDIILIAGKGHENYQEIKGVKYPFDDKQILKEIFDTIYK